MSEFVYLYLYTVLVSATELGVLLSILIGFSWLAGHTIKLIEGMDEEYEFYRILQKANKPVAILVIVSALLVTFVPSKKILPLLLVVDSLGKPHR